MSGRPLKYGVIAAAGKGTRAYPRTSYVPKPLFTFENQTLLEKNVYIQLKVLKVPELYIIVGHLKEQVLSEVERIRRHYPHAKIHTAEWTGKGLASDIAALGDRIDGDFSVILGDEFYMDMNHQALAKLWSQKKKAEAMIAVLKSDLLSEIRKNYSVELEGTRVMKLVEKPDSPPNDLLGLGTYIFSPEYFKAFRETPPSNKSGVVELTDVIDLMSHKYEVHAGLVKGRYYNINSLADYYSATCRIRSEKFHKFRTTLVVPAFNNERTLPDVLQDFRGRVNEIIVADMGSSDRTVEIARKAGAKVIQATESAGNPHGAQIIYRAFREASGDILVLATADGNFRANDLPKLLEYMKDSDMVVGTRTTRQLMEQGTNLGPLYRWLNVALGKLLEILWWDLEPRFTDIGCIYRAIWKDSFLKIAEELRATDRTYLAEMMIGILRFHMRCIEIPVSLYRRYGSVRTETTSEQWQYFFSVLRLIFGRRFTWLGKLFRVS